MNDARPCDLFFDSSSRRVRLAAAVLCAACAAPAACAAAGAPAADAAAGRRILVASHRADWQLAPENSLAALENAIRFGADIAETDVRLSKDGRLVVIHDPCIDRKTWGSGAISDLTLDEIKRHPLRDALGETTAERIPALEEYMSAAKGRILLYIDKAGQSDGALIPQILATARECGTLGETLFVLDWPYAKARRVFGDDLDKVLYCPVVDDRIPDLEAYVDDWLCKSRPFAFQLRFASLDTKTFALLPKILSSGARAFVAATWRNHTAGHDDRASILSGPEEGWGWLIDRGFTVVETNFPRELIKYLDGRGREAGITPPALETGVFTNFAR